MAGVSEGRAQALARQGKGLAKHLGVRKGTERWKNIYWGTKRAGGWKPSTEMGAAHGHRRK